MAKKVYEESSVQAIAAAIREKNGSTDTYKISNMAAAIRKLSGKEVIEWHQCPEAVRNYLANVSYDSSDYSTSQISNYAPANAVVSNYKPIGKTIDGKTYYNAVPNVKTPFATENAAGTLKPLDPLRWIRTQAGAIAWNARDLGGWPCDGGTVKYGLLFRGGKLAAADRAVLVGELGIQHDLDLRGREGGGPGDEPEMTASPLGSDVWYTRTQQYAWYALTPVESWQAYLRCVIDAVTHREPVYFHCTAGADRTGTLACVLEGILGMSQSDIDKDYELTCFYSGTSSDSAARRRNETDWTGLINAINAVLGDSFRDKCVHFAVGTCGMSMSDINTYRSAMIDGTPETLYWYQPITTTLIDCTISNSSVQIEYGEAYTATITPDAGKEMDEITVTMGGVDITASVVTGTTISIEKVTGAVTITATASVPSVTYSIMLNLTNVASSNSKNTIAEGKTYETELTPTGTFKKLGAITVTMGGLDISSTVVSGNMITIAKVTGDIVIACSAVITNIIDTIGISAGTRVSTSSGDNRAQSGYVAIGANKDAASLIHLTAGDTLRIKGASLPASNDSYSALAIYSASGDFIVATYLHNGITWNNLTFSNSGDTVVVTASAEHYFRISLICANADTVIATINEQIYVAEDIPVTGVTLSATSGKLQVGGTVTLVANVEPATATNRNVTWESSNNSIATVANGVVTAVAIGNVVITATTEDRGFTATYALTVEAKSITNIIDTIGISANTRLSTSSGENRTQSGYAAIGQNKDAASLIHLAPGDTLRIKGASLPASKDSFSAIALYNASGTFNLANYLYNGLAWNGLTFNNVGDSVVVTNDHGGLYYFRVSLICTDASAVIATINEEINES